MDFSRSPKKEPGPIGPGKKLDTVKKTMKTFGFASFLLFFVVGNLFVGDLFAAEKPLVAVMVSDDHYHADTLLPPLVEKLAQENHWNIVVLHGKGTSNFPDIDVLEKADTLVVFVRRLTLPKDQLATLKKYVESGRGLVALRTACHGFTLRNKPAPDGCENWSEFDADVLGGNYHDHGKDPLGSDIQNVESKLDSPILKDVKPDRWHSIGSLYWTAPIKDDTTLYQTGSSPEGKDVPVTWTRLHGKTRVAFTALGHPKDYEVEAFQKLLRNLIAWSLER